MMTPPISLPSTWTLPIHLSIAQQQTLALAAVFQAAQLVHIAAHKGQLQLEQVGQQHIQTLLHAALNIRATHNPNHNSLDMFQSIGALNLGLYSLEHCLIQPFETHKPDSTLAHQLKKRKKQAQFPLSYAMALLNLSAKVYKNPAFIQYIEQQQGLLLKQLNYFNYQYQHPTLLANFAQTYAKTAGQFKPSIMVKGTEHILIKPNERDLIRALLFAGLQAAHYWRDLGGSPWRLIFAKKKILKDIRHIAKIQGDAPHRSSIESEQFF